MRNVSWLAHKRGGAYVRASFSLSIISSLKKLSRAKGVCMKHQRRLVRTMQHLTHVALGLSADCRRCLHCLSHQQKTMGLFYRRKL